MIYNSWIFYHYFYKHIFEALLNSYIYLDNWKQESKTISLLFHLLVYQKQNIIIENVRQINYFYNIANIKFIYQIKFFVSKKNLYLFFFEEIILKKLFQKCNFYQILNKAFTKMLAKIAIAQK